MEVQHFETEQARQWSQRSVSEGSTYTRGSALSRACWVLRQSRSTLLNQLLFRAVTGKLEPARAGPKLIWPSARAEGLVHAVIAC